MGGFLSGYFLGQPFKDCFEIGNKASIELLKRVGCDCPLTLDLIKDSN